jgi:hypothetical protein
MGAWVCSLSVHGRRFFHLCFYLARRQRAPTMVPMPTPIRNAVTQFAAMAVLAGFSCAHRPSLAPAPSESIGRPTSRDRSVSLVVGLPIGAGRMLPVPLVRGRLADRPVWFMIDTGAGSHLVADWAAKEVGLALRSADVSAVGQGGVPVQGLKVADMDRLSLDGWGPLQGETALVAKLPALFAQAQIAALVNPQLLARSAGTIVELDFIAGRMSELAATVPADVRPGKRLTLRPGRVCSDQSTPIPNLVHLVHAVVGGQELLLTLDTGGTTTTVYVGTDAGRALLAAGAAQPEDRPGLSVGGAFSSRTLPGVPLVVGELQQNMDLSVDEGHAPAGCPSSGILCMDVLSRCVLTLSATAVSGICEAH